MTGLWGHAASGDPGGDDGRGSGLQRERAHATGFPDPHSRGVRPVRIAGVSPRHNGHLNGHLNNPPDSSPLTDFSDFLPAGGVGTTRTGQFASAQLRDAALKHAWSHVLAHDGQTQDS